MTDPQCDTLPDGDYELIDFGEGRKLERFGEVILDRVCPAAEGTPRSLDRPWQGRTTRLDAKGRVVSGKIPASWQIQLGPVRFALSITPFGHVGVFPEHASNWPWLSEQLFSSNPEGGQEAPKVLNLFAYTGGTTLFLAAQGASVVHVDSSEPAVKWARRNAALSELEDRPVRWLVEDANKFVAREIRREQCYDMIALDPPSYGHGPKGQRWDIQDDLEGLLQNCRKILSPAGRVLLTAHSSTPSQAELEELYEKALGLQPTSKRLVLRDRRGRPLDAGFYCR